MENTEISKMENTTVLAAAEAAQTAVSVGNVWSNKEQFNQLLRSAQMLSQVSIIPQNYQGKPQDCFVALEMAERMGMSPIFVMQNMYVVKGKPSWSGQGCTAMIQNCGRFKDVRHVYTGEKGTDSRGCYVTAVRISDGEQVDGVEVTLGMAKAEGWTSNSKWRNMPELMLAYRAAAFFARVHCPEALMGMQTREEVEDVEAKDTFKAASDLSAALKGGAK
ncbi:MAG: recombinase RecT [Ruminococcus sp.]|nr:recombinase RecT [Ruminococcus sp.]MCM1380308.1 recombinase RecT [Muribaculaceae bacterium]MCM1478288.1 recombinase RecT [Muribaculaceae bacterium]